VIQAGSNTISEPSINRVSASSSIDETIEQIIARDLHEAAAVVLRAQAVASDQPSDSASLLVSLANCVDRRAEGIDLLVDPRADSAEGRRLLTELRMATVRSWAENDTAPSPERMLAVWNACESILIDLGRGAQYAGGLDVERGFSNQMSGPRGLELIVEVAHDLRSPLTSILFLAETLQRGQSGSVNDVQRRQLGLIYSAALGLSTLASNVMELARGGNRLAEDAPAPFSVADVFESVADIVRPMAEEKGLTVRLLPPTADHRLGPAQALSRVLLNLTTNAIKFTEEGLVEIVARSLDDDRVEFSVRDTGHGINPEAIPTLFQPFRPGPEGHRATFSGTGLGLALCRKLVEAMGSELRYESGSDWGTRFYFELKLPIPPR
jgi:signal transduction histidine kinase